MSRTLYTSTPTVEMPTRHCLDPWFNVMLDSRRGVQPCCWHPAIATLPIGGSLNDLLEGPATGEPNEHCRQCPVRPLTTPNILRNHLLEELTEIPD